MKKSLFKYVTTFTLGLLVFTGCSSENSTNTTSGEANEPNETESVNVNSNESAQKLELISFLPVDHMLTKDVIPMWIDMVEEELNGEIEIEWVGGPESIPSTDQFNAVKNGLVDINFNVSSMFANLMPEAHSMLMSSMTPREERENGYFDYMGERFEENGVQYLGRWLYEELFLVE